MGLNRNNAGASLQVVHQPNLNEVCAGCKAAVAVPSTLPPSGVQIALEWPANNQDASPLPCSAQMLMPDSLPGCIDTQLRYALHRASAADSAELSRLMTETFLAAYGHVAPADRLARHISSQYAASLIEQRIAGGLIEVWVARAAGTTSTAGYLQLGLQWSAPEALADVAALEVQRCYLRPEHIGAGAADLLMQQAQQRARDLGANALHLSVYQLAPRAIRFYEKHGFQRCMPIQYYIDDVAFDDWLMVWRAP